MQTTKHDTELVKRHTPHGWKPARMDHIRNVPRAADEQIMSCPCGWYGWIPRQLLHRNPTEES